MNNSHTNNPQGITIDSSTSTDKKHKPLTRRSSGSIVWALLLIFAGVVFLLNNFGIVPWEIWNNIWRFWPLLLVLWGFQIIFGRTLIGTLLTTLFALLAFGVALLIILASVNPSINQWIKSYLPNIRIDAFMQSYTQLEESQEVIISTEKFQNVTKRNFSASIGGSELVVEDNQGSNYLELSANYLSPDFKPNLTSSSESGVLNIKLDNSNSFHGWPVGVFGKNKYSVTLGQPNLPTNIDINIGAGTGKLKYQSLILNNFKLNIGAGSAKTSFSQASAPTFIDINVGAGSANIDLPEDIGVGGDYNVGLGQLIVDGKTFTGRGQFESSNYSLATKKIILKIRIGAGKVEIER